MCFFLPLWGALRVPSAECSSMWVARGSTVGKIQGGPVKMVAY